MGRVVFLEPFIRDIRYALKGLAKSPVFSAVAILTLALGIGASMAVLTVVNPVLLRPLPFPDSGRLVALTATTPTRSRDSTSFPDFLDWKSQGHAFTGVAAYRSDRFGVSGGGNPEPVIGLRASHELFQVLRMVPLIGRAFDQKEQHANSAVALISYRLWRRRFGGDPDLEGKTILLDGVSHSVIGVLPEGFQFPAFLDPDVLAPISESSDRSRGYLFAVARLKPGVRTEAAQIELDAIAGRLGQAFPASNQGRGVRVQPLQEAAAGNVRTPLLVLMGAAIFVLLIGCANAGNLVLAKGIARGREFALRSALGAGTGRLIRQLLTESVVLALVAALLGSALAFWGSKFLAASLSQRFALPPILFDWRLLAGAVLTALLSGILCGLPPALMVRKSHLADSLREGNRGPAGGRAEHRLRSLLLTSEIALTVVLLVGAGLLLKSFVLLLQTDLGLDPHHVLTADLLLSGRYADPERRDVFLREMLESVGALPGVQQVAVHTDPPFLGGGAQETFHVEGHPDPAARQGHPIAFNVVSTAFFNAMGIPIKRGRGFDLRDTPAGAPVAIINEAMARRFWPGGDPTGKRIRLYYDRDPQHWFTIAGVAGDVRYRSRDTVPIPQVFVLYQQKPYRTLPYPQEPFVSLVVRASADPARMITAVQTRIWAVDKDQPVSDIQTMENALSQSVADRRVYILLLGSFAAIALIMAAAGIYGLVSYAVESRTQEMGIRVALGATGGQVLALVLRRGMLLASIGIVIGIGVSLALTKLISGLLYGITATDAPTFAVTAVVFAAVAFAATYIPARRAATIDPAVAFRCE